MRLPLKLALQSAAVALLGIAPAQATDISSLSPAAGTTLTLTAAGTPWTISADGTVGGLAVTRTGGGQDLAFSGSTGSETLVFANSSTPLVATNSYYSGNFYWGGMTLHAASGLNVQSGYNNIVLQSGLAWSASSGGTLKFQQANNDGSMIVAQGDDVLPAGMDLDVSSSGANTFLILNGGTTQTIGSLSSSGTPARTYIAAYSGGNGLSGGNPRAGANVLGSAAAATLRLGADNANASFGGIIGATATDSSAAARAIHLVKLGAGTQTLAGVNTYAGTTTVSAGTLTLSGAGSIANTASITVADGATLDLTAQTTPALDLSAKPLTLGVGTTTRGFVNIGSGTLALGSTLALQFTSSTLNASYNLYDAGTVSGSFSSIAVSGAIGTGSLVDDSGTWTGTVGAYILTLDQSTGALTIAPSGGGTPPPAPATITVTSDFEQINLAWDAVADAVSYTIRRSTTEGSGYVDLANGLTGTTYTDTTGAAGVTYYYVVVAVNVNGESDPTPAGSGSANIRAAIGLNIRAFNTYGMPVTDLGGVSRKAWWNNLVGPAYAGHTVTLDTFADHLGNPVSGLAASLTLGTGSTAKLGSDAVTVAPASNDANLYSSALDQYNGTSSTLTLAGIPYSSYDFVVYVRDDGSLRGGIITVNGSTLAIRGGAGNPAADGTGYVRSTDATNTSGSSVQQGNYVRFNGLSGDLTATFVATDMGDNTRRLKIAGFQILSNDVVAAPAASPAAPAGLTASGSNRQVALNWTHRSSATAYKIYRGGSLLATVAAPIASYADLDVTNGTAYGYTISAVNAVGEGARTSSVSATPAAPAFTLSERDVYQYSIAVTAIYSSRAADPMRRAYLWVPPGLTRLQGVMVGLHNMLEKPMFEDPVIRQACAEAGLGIVFITPGDSTVWTPDGVGNYTAGPKTTALNLDPEGYDTIDINPATGTAFAGKTEQAAAELSEILRRLSVESGYAELDHAPIMLVGHSAASPFTWTRGIASTSFLDGRVFAILPYKGTFAGSVPDGMPVFHVASEWQEISQWGNTWEVGDAPSARNLRAGGADRLVAEFVQPGTGHYQYSETQSAPIASFIKGAASARIPLNWTTTAAPTLNTLEASSGYLVDVTTLGSGSAAPVAYADWVAAGKDPLRAYWYVDLPTARSACDAMNAGFAKKPQLISAYKNSTTLADLSNQSNGAGAVYLSAALQGDGVTFQLRAAALNQSPIPKLFHGAPLGISSAATLFKANRSGALKQTGVDTFRVWLDRGSVIKTGQPWEPFIIAWNPGDAGYREADRPIQLGTAVPVNLTSFSGGSTQTITFAAIANQSADDLPVLALDAASSAGSSYPVQYFMVSGPYRNDEVDSGILVPDTVPAGAKFPLRVLVGAWQWGKPGVMQSAAPVYRTFWIFKNRLQKWQFDHFGSSDANGTPVIPAGNSDTAADPDRDGRNNLLEYALGTDPAAADQAAPTSAATVADHLQLTFNRIADPAITYTVQATDDLASAWTDIWTSTGTGNTAGPVTVEDPQALATPAKRFLRLKITP